ncbi:MAG: benzoate-CoA ligase family protein [Pseudomonadota bacterium]|nr:benzoate-CoA ligase family protein [Pseudomonadota bacterium]
MSCERWGSVDYGVETPQVSFPAEYNAAVDFIDRHLVQGRGSRTAYIDAAGEHTYADLAARVNRAGNLLKELGVTIEQRVFLCLLDGIDFPAFFWGAIKIGAVPVPVNTLLTAENYATMLRHSRAGVLVVSAPLTEKFSTAVADQPFLRDRLVMGGEVDGWLDGDGLLVAAHERLDPAPTCADDAAFWLYSSGSTGEPKGAVHLHGDLLHTAVLYGVGVLGLREADRVFSAAKLFFAYGLGNAMSFPLHVGATTILLADRPTPDAVMKVLREQQPTVFYGVPTLFGALLADPGNDRESGSAALRLCTSAGEALPAEIGLRWRERFGVDILDGLGSTEMLHIFLSNRPGDLKYGTSGKPVPGYELRLVDERGGPVRDGELGELLVKGPSAAACYFNSRAKSLATFEGTWTRTGDKYSIDTDGYYVYGGRSDDMLKVGGIWVSPFEVESALVAHDKVLEAAVVGQQDHAGLVKPKAYIVPAPGVTGDDSLAEDLKAWVKERLAPYKYPRWIEFVSDLPKTATGKIQRFRLRG